MNMFKHKMTSLADLNGCYNYKAKNSHNSPSTEK
jgi:hypothetical protein